MAYISAWNTEAWSPSYHIVLNTTALLVHGS